MPLYVPKFRSGWEPPLDVLQEAPWEVEGLASVPSDQLTPKSRLSVRHSPKHSLSSEPQAPEDIAPPGSSPHANR